MENLQTIFLILLGVIKGFVIGLIILRRSKNKLLKDYAVLEERKKLLLEEKSQLSDQLDRLRSDLRSSELSNEGLRIELEFQKQRNLESGENLKEIKRQMQLEFSQLAHKVIHDSSDHITTKSTEKISSLLEPMKERLSGFEKKIEDQFKEGYKHQSELFGAFKEMHQLNRELQGEAEQLVNTLRGDVKRMGSWGELILEKVLDISGLREGKEYKREVQIKDENGKSLRPDVILFLPDDKHIIIDSKVSLLAYERYIKADTDQERTIALNDHRDSVKNHIKNLADKSYQNLPKLHTPDYVLLFMPIESAFGLALEADHSIFEYAWDRKVVIVSPSTLLATLKTIHAIWQSEKQSQNAEEIARQGGALYDKFVNFVSELEKVGKQIDQAQSSYTGAMKKLSSGRGNLITRVENLKTLGAKSSKDLNKYIEEHED